MKSLGFNYEKLSDNLKIISMSPRLFTEGALYFYMEKLVKNLKPERLIVDSLARHYDEEEFLELARSLILLCKKHGVTCLLTSLKDLMKGEELTISTAVDNTVSLWFNCSGNEVKRMITVFKERMSTHDPHKHTLHIEKGEVVIRWAYNWGGLGLKWWRRSSKPWRRFSAHPFQ